MKTIARFDIGYEQLLDPEGKAAAKRLPAFAKDTDTLLELYRTMALTRAFDTRAIALQRTGKLGTYASCLGHEATHVGAASALAENDVMAPSYREYGAQFTRGVKPEQVLLYWGGDERGNVYEGTAARDFAWCVPISSQTLYAAGAALAFKTRKEKNAVMVFLGDGGTSEGAFAEAMNAAGVWDLPIVFVITNNRWAISVPLDRQTRAETLAQKAIAAGIKGVQVDGNDVIAVRKTADEALKRARSGKGPTVIECLTYRLSDHTTADDATRYRKDEEVEAARAKEPLVRTRKYLESLGIWDDKKEKALADENKKAVEAAVKAYQDTARDSVTAMFDDMYDELPDSLAEQRETALTEEANHGE